MNPGSPYGGLRRHEEYYISTGDLHLVVDHTRFRVHRYFYERESEFFRRILLAPASPGATRQGASDDNAIQLDYVTSDEFAKFNWVFYNPKYSLYDKSAKDWQIILRLAYRWGFPDVHELAVRELDKLYVPDIDRVVMYQDYEVDRRKLVPCYAALAERADPITLDEGERLGLSTVIMLAQARELARAGPQRELAPAGLRRDEMEEIVKDVFDIEAPPVDMLYPQAYEGSIAGSPSRRKFSKGSRRRASNPMSRSTSGTYSTATYSTPPTPTAQRYSFQERPRSPSPPPPRSPTPTPPVSRTSSRANTRQSTPSSVRRIFSPTIEPGSLLPPPPQRRKSNAKKVKSKSPPPIRTSYSALNGKYASTSTRAEPPKVVERAPPKRTSDSDVSDIPAGKGKQREDVDAWTWDDDEKKSTRTPLSYNILRNLERNASLGPNGSRSGTPGFTRRSSSRMSMGGRRSSSRVTNYYDVDSDMSVNGGAESFHDAEDWQSFGDGEEVFEEAVAHIPPVDEPVAPVFQPFAMHAPETPVTAVPLSSLPSATLLNFTPIEQTPDGELRPLEELKEEKPAKQSEEQRSVPETPIEPVKPPVDVLSTRPPQAPLMETPVPPTPPPPASAPSVVKTESAAKNSRSKPQAPAAQAKKSGAAAKAEPASAPALSASDLRTEPATTPSKERSSSPSPKSTEKAAEKAAPSVAPAEASTPSAKKSKRNRSRSKSKTTPSAPREEAAPRASDAEPAPSAAKAEPTPSVPTVSEPQAEPATSVREEESIPARNQAEAVIPPAKAEPTAAPEVKLDPTETKVEAEKKQPAASANKVEPTTSTPKVEPVPSAPNGPLPSDAPKDEPTRPAAEAQSAPTVANVETKHATSDSKVEPAPSADQKAPSAPSAKDKPALAKVESTPAASTEPSTATESVPSYAPITTSPPDTSSAPPATEPATASASQTGPPPSNETEPAVDTTAKPETTADAAPLAESCDKTVAAEPALSPEKAPESESASSQTPASEPSAAPGLSKKARKRQAQKAAGEAAAATAAAAAAVKEEQESSSTPALKVEGEPANTPLSEPAQGSDAALTPQENGPAELDATASSANDKSLSKRKRQNLTKAAQLAASKKAAAEAQALLATPTTKVAKVDPAEEKQTASNSPASVTKEPDTSTATPTAENKDSSISSAEAKPISPVDPLLKPQLQEIAEPDNDEKALSEGTLVSQSAPVAASSTLADQSQAAVSPPAEGEQSTPPAAPKDAQLPSEADDQAKTAADGTITSGPPAAVTPESTDIRPATVEQVIRTVPGVTDNAPSSASVQGPQALSATEGKVETPLAGQKSSEQKPIVDEPVQEEQKLDDKAQAKSQPGISTEGKGPATPEASKVEQKSTVETSPPFKPPTQLAESTQNIAPNALTDQTKPLPGTATSLPSALPPTLPSKGTSAFPSTAIAAPAFIPASQSGPQRGAAVPNVVFPDPVSTRASNKPSPAWTASGPTGRPIQSATRPAPLVTPSKQPLTSPKSATKSGWGGGWLGGITSTFLGDSSPVAEEKPTPTTPARSSAPPGKPATSGFQARLAQAAALAKTLPPPAAKDTDKPKAAVSSLAGASTFKAPENEPQSSARSPSTRRNSAGLTPPPAWPAPPPEVPQKQAGAKKAGNDTAKGAEETKPAAPTKSAGKVSTQPATQNTAKPVVDSTKAPETPADAKDQLPQKDAAKGEEDKSTPDAPSAADTQTKATPTGGEKGSVKQDDQQRDGSGKAVTSEPSPVVSEPRPKPDAVASEAAKIDKLAETKPAVSSDATTAAAAASSATADPSIPPLKADESKEPSEGPSADAGAFEAKVGGPKGLADAKGADAEQTGSEAVGGAKEVEVASTTQSSDKKDEVKPTMDAPTSTTDAPALAASTPSPDAAKDAPASVKDTAESAKDVTDAAKVVPESVKANDAEGTHPSAVTGEALTSAKKATDEAKDKPDGADANAEGKKAMSSETELSKADDTSSKTKDESSKPEDAPGKVEDKTATESAPAGGDSSTTKPDETKAAVAPADALTGTDAMTADTASTSPAGADASTADGTKEPAPSDKDAAGTEGVLVDVGAPSTDADPSSAEPPATEGPAQGDELEKDLNAAAKGDKLVEGGEVAKDEKKVDEASVKEGGLATETHAALSSDKEEPKVNKEEPKVDDAVPSADTSADAVEQAGEDEKQKDGAEPNAANPSTTTTEAPSKITAGIEEGSANQAASADTAESGKGKAGKSKTKPPLAVSIGNKSQDKANGATNESAQTPASAAPIASAAIVDEPAQSPTTSTRPSTPGGENAKLTKSQKKLAAKKRKKAGGQ